MSPFVKVNNGDMLFTTTFLFLDLNFICVYYYKGDKSMFDYCIQILSLLDQLLCIRNDNDIDLELTIDPAPPPGGIFGTMIFLYLMVCSIQKKMIATFCWGFKELWAFKIRYHLKCHFLYI